MARVPKYKIDEMVKFLIKPLLDKREVLTNKTKEVSEKILDEIIPQEIKDLPENIKKEYLINRKYLYVYVLGLGKYTLCFNDFNYTCLNQTSLDLNAEHSKLIVDLENEMVKINEELKTLRQTISNTLSTLSTEKRILVEFPELSNFFVTNSGVTTLALPIQSIRDILGKYDN